MLLSYGQYATSKKLFSFEQDGVNKFPVFTDLDKAQTFLSNMQRAMRELDDDRELTIQVCTNPSHALDMFQAIATLSSELIHVTIDQTTLDTTSSKSGTLRDIASIISELQESTSKQR